MAVEPPAFDSDPKGGFYRPQFASAAQEHFAWRAPTQIETRVAQPKNVKNTGFNWRAIQKRRCWIRFEAAWRTTSTHTGSTRGLPAGLERLAVKRYKKVCLGRGKCRPEEWRLTVIPQFRLRCSAMVAITKRGSP